MLVGSLAVALLIVEVVARALYGDRTVLFPRFHAAAEYGRYTLRSLRPDATFWHRSVDGAWKFTTNSRGLRSEREHAYGKARDTLRVLCLGDSQTQGFECRQDRTYAKVIERYLVERGLAAEVINAGISGFSTAEALAYLENEGVRYEPDVVVLGFFANDFDDNVKADLFRLNDGVLVDQKYAHIPGVKAVRIVNAIPPLRWLSQNSYAYSRLFNSIWDWRKRALLSDKERELATEFAMPREEADAALRERKYALCAALLARMHNVCRRRGSRFAIVDIPVYSGDEKASRSSIPAELRPRFRGSADAVIWSADVLADCQAVADLFVPHGQHHISETTHLRLGVACAKEIMAVAGAARKQEKL